MAVSNRLVVSNIAWTNEEELLVARKLQELGVKYVEIAPTKMWREPAEVTDKQISEYLDFWKRHDINVVAFQSVLFRHPEMQIFQDEANRQATLKCLQEYTQLASKMGVKILVFGSPKNRVKGQLRDAEAQAIAIDFFGLLGETANANGVIFCVEPNPPEYACDFITNTAQGIALVEAIGKPGFGLHLDIAGMAMVHDDITASIKNTVPLLKHFHLSAPFLQQVEPREDIAYKEALDALENNDYQGFVSIEMRPGEHGENVVRVEEAVGFIQSL